jgi:hypothetical protein
LYQQYPTRSYVPPLQTPRTHEANDHASNPWMLWRPESPAETEVLTVAELAECRCPDLCNRDHGNE